MSPSQVSGWRCRIRGGDTGAADLTFFVATVRPDGRPHSAGVGAVWVDDALTAPFTAPSAGPAPWHLYRLTLHDAVGAASAEPHGATRWDFAHE